MPKLEKSALLGDMTLENETSPSKEVTTLDQEVEGLRRLVEEQQRLIEKLSKELGQKQERIEQLEASLLAEKKLKDKPAIRPSLLNQSPSVPTTAKRAGSVKKSKKLNFEIDEEIIIIPPSIPEGAKLNGYRDYDVQDIIIKRHNIRFKLAEYITVDGKTYRGELPAEYQGKHYGLGLICYVMYQHYQCRVPQTLIYEQLREWGIDISTGQVNRLLNEEHQIFEQEQQQVLKVGLETAGYIHTDDTGARHNGKNGYCTVIGNENFTYFKSSDSKSRLNFLSILQGEEEKYVLNEEARAYLEKYEIPQKYQEQLEFSKRVLAQTKEEWLNYLESKGIGGEKTVRIISEAALIGALTMESRSEPLRILSDGAGQFNIMEHGLCWVHAERSLRKLDGKTDLQRENIAGVQTLLWDYYQELKRYRLAPSSEGKAELWQKFDDIFGKHYENHGLLNDVLRQMINHKSELLAVLNFPKLPLHNNAAETDIREYVTRRKISGGTRSELGRTARDTFVGLKKTCRKLGISFWQYLKSRLHQDRQVPDLADVIRELATEKISVPT